METGRKVARALLLTSIGRIRRARAQSCAEPSAGEMVSASLLLHCTCALFVARARARSQQQDMWATVQVSL